MRIRRAPLVTGSGYGNQGCRKGCRKGRNQGDRSKLDALPCEKLADARLDFRPWSAEAYAARGDETMGI